MANDNDTPTGNSSRQQLLDDIQRIMAEPGGVEVITQALAMFLLHRRTKPTEDGEEKEPFIFEVPTAIDRDRWGDPHYEAARSAARDHFSDFDKAATSAVDAYDMAKVLRGYLVCDNVEPNPMYAESVAKHIYKLVDKVRDQMESLETQTVNLFLAYQDLAMRYTQECRQFALLYAEKTQDTDN